MDTILSNIAVKHLFADVYIILYTLNLPIFKRFKRLLGKSGLMFHLQLITLLNQLKTFLFAI